MRYRVQSVVLPALAFVGTACSPGPDNAALEQQVLETERAFAQTMAERDHAKFATFLSNEAIFFSGNDPIRGKDAIAESWKMFFEGPAAPFSWAPERVQVLDSGTLALSSGPVLDPAGMQIATFNSIWRLEAPNTWHIVFDKGAAVCTCP